MQPGLYFRRETNEIATLRANDPPLGDGRWELVADTLDAGLVGARALLVEHGLADRTTAAHAYWVMPTPARHAADASSPGTAPA